MWREVTLIDPGPADADDFFPKGPASVCVEGPPQRQCYTAPKEFGNSPTVEVIQLDKDTPALFFSAASGGVSGWQVHFALLRSGTGKDLENFFLSDSSVSNQSHHAFWNEPAISDAQIFLTADYVWGPDEAHYSDHRYIISSYVRKAESLLDGLQYYLEDQYMTVRKYDSDAKTDILGSEKQEILARLKRVKAEQQREPR